MSYPFNEDHDMIREAVKGFATDWYDGGKGPERVYESGTPFDADAWTGLTQELGMGGVAIAEEYGGAGLGDLGRVVVMEELGASLCAVPFFTTCGIVTDLLSAVGTDDAKAKYLPKITTGEMSATYCDGHDAINGHITNVVNAGVVGTVFLSRRTGKGIEVIAVPAKADGLVIAVKETMDPTRGLADIDFSKLTETDIDVIGTTTEAKLQDIVASSFVALAAECLGGAQKCLDITLEYAAQRIQFDRPIASFQAVKHRCADMFIALEAARSAVYAAAIAAEDKTEAAKIAKAKATEAYFEIAGHAIQMHGGIGFTWEYPLHYFFKRARANRAVFGTLSDTYDQLADHIFGDVA